MNTRMFAMPYLSDQFYELKALSVSSCGDGIVEVESNIEDWKYIKRQHKARALMLFGFMFPDGQRLTVRGFIESRRRDPLGCTCHFEIRTTEHMKEIE